jgi:ribonuclease BN (tRNA processing enzyme)
VNSDLSNESATADYSKNGHYGPFSRTVGQKEVEMEKHSLNARLVQLKEEVNENMKLTIIGPWGGYPKANEASSGYLLQQGEFNLLIDCGSGVLSFLQNHIDPVNLNAVVISHYHPDHIADIGVLQHALLIGKYFHKEIKTLPIYGHRESEEYKSLTYKDITKGLMIDENTKLSIGPFSVRFLKTRHPVPCYAMKIVSSEGTLVYTADSAYQEAFVDFAKDCDLLLCESNLFSGMNGDQAGHMTSTEAGRIAKRSGAKKLVLTHLPQYGSLQQLKEEAEREYDGPVILAEKDLQIIVNR